MNDIDSRQPDGFLEYQSQRFMGVLAEMVSCCEDRKLYETRRFSLPYAELRCLKLFDRGHYMTSKAISQALDIAKSRASKIVDGLIRKGLLEAVEDPKDGRVRLLSLTGLGRAKLRDINDFEREIHRKVLLHLDPEERKRALAYMEQIRSAMEAVKADLV